MDDDRGALSQLIRKHSLRKGEVVLTSGRKGSYYLDCRVTTLHPLGAFLTARLILRTLRERGIEADALGGPTLGADPIAGAVAAVSAIEDTPMPAFIVRKEVKGHGTGRRIEGWSGEPGDRVVVVDDVCTSGGSILRACEQVEAAGYRVAAVVCVVDREEGGTEAVGARYPFFALFTVGELLA